MADRGLAAATREGYGGSPVAPVLPRIERSLRYRCRRRRTVLAFWRRCRRGVEDLAVLGVSNLRPFLAFTGRADLVDA